MPGRQKFALSVAVLCLSAGLVACARSPQAKEARFLKRGQSFIEKKDYARAVLEFQNAARVMPKHAEPYYQMALAFLAQRNLEASVPALVRAVRLDPKHAPAQVKLAELMLSSQQKDLAEDARKRLNDVLAASPDNTQARQALAVAEFRLGRPEDAIRLLEAVLEKSPADLQGAVIMARFKLGQGDPAAAEEVLRKAVSSAPQSPETALALGRLYVLNRKPDQAETEFRRALQLNPRFGPALFSMGLLKMNASRPEAAEPYFKQLAGLSETEYRPLYGLFLFQRGEKEAALAEFLRVYQLDPADRGARTRLSTAYLQTGKAPEAEKVLAAALKRNPKDTDALLQRSELRLRVRDIDGAQNDINQMLSIQSTSAAAHLQLARVYQLQHLAKSARQELSTAVLQDPSYLLARLALARDLLLADEFKAALDLVDKAPAQQRNSPALAVERNWALLGLGNVDEARKSIQQALAAGRTVPVLEQAGYLKSRDKDYEGARKDAEEILRLDPGNLKACQLIVNTWAAQKQVSRAVDRLREIVAARPGSGPVQNLLGQLLASSGDLAGARKALQAAVSAAPGFTPARLSLARLDASAKQWDAARRHVNAALAVDRRDPAALLVAADIEMSAGDRAASIAKYRSLLDVDGSNVLALNNLAYLLGADSPDEALKLAQQAIALTPDNAAVQDTLGWIYYRKGMYDMAVTYLKRAVARESTPRRQFHLASSYLKAGDRDLGQRLMSAALKQDPALLKTEQGW